MTSDPASTRCPYCAEEIHPQALKCRHCLSMLQGADGRQLCITCRTRIQPTPPETSDRDDIDLLSLQPADLVIEVSDALGSDDPARFSEDLDHALDDMRRSIATRYGVVPPRLVVTASPSLPARSYRLIIRGVAGSTALVDDDSVNPVTDIAQQVRADLDLNLEALLSREEVARMLNATRRTHPTVVAELVPNLLALGQIRRVLQLLVRERVPINDLPTILNALADQSIFTKDVYQLTEHVRVALGATITARLTSRDGDLRAFTLAPETERVIQSSIQFVENEQQLMMRGEQSASLQTGLSDALERHGDHDLEPVIVVGPRIRRHLKELFERSFDDVHILSYTEVLDRAFINELETIALDMSELSPSAAMKRPDVESDTAGYLIVEQTLSAIPDDDEQLIDDPDG